MLLQLMLRNDDRENKEMKEDDFYTSFLGKRGFTWRYLVPGIFSSKASQLGR